MIVVRKILLKTAIGILGLLTICNSSLGSTTTTTYGSFSVQIIVQSACTVSASDLDFGTYSLAQLGAHSTITVVCTNGTAWTLSLSSGSGTFTTLTMLSGSNHLNYNLYTSAAKTQVWGDGTGSTGTVTGTGTGSSQSAMVYGSMPASQASAVGSYSDTITVTASF